MTKSGTEKFFADLRAAIENAEALLKSTAGDISDAREKARDKLREASEGIREIERGLLTDAAARAKAANDYVHENPWPSIALAAGVAFALGLLLSRRR